MLIKPRLYTSNFDYKKELEGCTHRSGHYFPDNDDRYSGGIQCHITNSIRSLKGGVKKLITYIGVSDYDYYDLRYRYNSAYSGEFIAPNKDGEKVSHMPFDSEKLARHDTFRSMNDTKGHIGLHKDRAYIWWGYDKPVGWDSEVVRSKIEDAILYLGRCKHYAKAHRQALNENKDRLAGGKIVGCKGKTYWIPNAILDRDWKHDESLIL